MRARCRMPTEPETSRYASSWPTEDSWPRKDQGSSACSASGAIFRRSPAGVIWCGSYGYRIGGSASRKRCGSAQQAAKFGRCFQQARDECEKAMKRGLVALLALIVMGNALEAAGEASASRH